MQYLVLVSAIPIFVVVRVALVRVVIPVALRVVHFSSFLFLLVDAAKSFRR